MLIDLHTHTRPLSHDSFLTPDDLIEAAKAAGLDAVCLTEHDFVWDPEAARDLARRHSFRITPAPERENPSARELCDLPPRPSVAASDAHQREDIGRCATRFERDLTDVPG